MAKGKAKSRVARRLVTLLVLLAAGAFALTYGRTWLEKHPQHNPWAPLDLDNPRGWATSMKIGALRSDPAACRAVLERSDIAFTQLQPAGEDACRRDDRLLLPDSPLVPANPEMTCPVAVGLSQWLTKDVRPLAEEMLGSPIARVEQLGTYNCRRIGGGSEGRWSEHATGNAIDISAFVLQDGTRISLLADWDDIGEAGRFLRAAHDSACLNFGIVLSPEYNAAHADHFHLDQGRRPTAGMCR
ncbi:extensin-like domain-containing protein [Aurantiacibacter sediminis]|uniref:Extensin family protein n=1 Tax=Aurantiacibacter sediminis TaxID=2793064 RepID=A0ABS0N3G4_9SPHN|nr:extensin family protein [Aurantiacibacter sediminis]MBH5322504.1 extensin family protein [Aurantiacibacter sediminis]